MTNRIVDGDYIKTHLDRLETIDNEQELIQTAGQILYARRGSFYPNKDFGSMIRLGELKKPELEYALSYARQALDTLDGVYVKSVNSESDGLVFDLMINETEGRVEVKL